MIEKIGATILEAAKNKAIKTIIGPLNEAIDTNLSDISTTIGSFIIRNIRGKFQRSVSFTVGINYGDTWMEEALYGILYEYNDFKQGAMLKIDNANVQDGSSMYYKLSDGAHGMKYRNWNILVVIQTKTPPAANGRIMQLTSYQIITYDLSPDFVKAFEFDMISHRNSLLKIKADSPTLNVYRDGHEHDGYTYWEKVLNIPKRKLNTMYLPYEQKKLLVDTINNFFASKDFYHQHGIPWNLKILLYGEAGTGKTSLVKVIASEWNRNIFEITGGKNGKFIPDALTDWSTIITYPLFSISDVDKYPALVNEPEVDMTKDNAKEEVMNYKQQFNNMINALDGITSGEGKIIIMTTNHIEKFSDVILRPGRIDLKMHIGCVIPSVFRKFVYDFYDGKILPKNIELTSDKVTVADLQFDAVFLRMPYDEFIKKYVK